MNPPYVRPHAANGIGPGPEQIHVLLPKLGRAERAFAEEIGRIIGPAHVAFMHEDRVVEVFDEPLPEREKDRRLDRNKLAVGGAEIPLLYRHAHQSLDRTIPHYRPYGQSAG
jgi:hypothetical protein